jgi:hypothetical protein
MITTINYLSLNLMSKISTVWHFADYSHTLVSFVLQFIPPPILILFLIEIGTGILGFIFGVLGKFKLMIKWW